jgi:hypothetical protein
MKKIALMMALLPTLSFAAKVKVVTHLDYVDEDSLEKKTYHTEENLNLNSSRSDGRPLMMRFSNAYAMLRGEDLPHIDLRFSFPKKTMKKDHTYTCTEGYYDKSECRVQLLSAIIDLNVPSGETVCKMKVQGTENFSYEYMTHNSSLPSYPSVVDKGSLWGLEMAMSFSCKNKASGETVLKGYFQHNSDRIPDLN